jgi:hypothetical protein
MVQSYYMYGNYKSLNSEFVVVSYLEKLELDSWYASDTSYHFHIKLAPSSRARFSSQKNFKIPRHIERLDICTEH